MSKTFLHGIALILAGLAVIAFTAIAQTVDAEPAAVKGKSLTIFSTENFIGSGQCAVCHSALYDEADNYVGMDRHWRSTMMANAARDPYWQAKVSSEVARAPQFKAIIEDTCAKCHMPMAHTQATENGTSTTVLGTGFLNTKNGLHAAAMDGVSCSLCHQVQADNLGSTTSFNGGYHIDTLTAPPERAIFGPFDMPYTVNMRLAVGFTPQFGSQMLKADHCGTCHTLYTPYVDNEGAIAGTFPEQMTLLEWRNSSFGKGANPVACQNCHMPEADGGVIISNMPQGQLKPRSPFAQHFFVGGNTFMLRMLKANIRKLGLTADDTHFDDTIARATSQLQQQTATLTIASSSLSAATLNVVLKVGVKTGHKFPTGFPARRAWIYFSVKDADGTEIFSSGAVKTDGTIEDNDADIDPETFEPHHDVITSEEQVQIYETVMGDVDDKVTHTLLRSAGYLKDNRLLPTGYKAKKASADIAVYGAAKQDRNFKGGSDLVTYRVPLGAANGPFTITARLYYQGVAPAFINDLKTVKTKEAKTFTKLAKKTAKTPDLVAEAERTLD